MWSYVIGMNSIYIINVITVLEEHIQTMITIEYIVGHNYIRLRNVVISSNTL